MRCEREHVSIEQYLTVFIDYEKYRHTIDSHSQRTGGTFTDRPISKECSELDNQEYRMCGRKCVLSCRHDPVSWKFMISKRECDTTKCFDGCFCKSGFVLYQNKCVPANECPARKNKEIDFEFTDDTDGQMKIQNSTQIKYQMQVVDSNQAQIEKNITNPKILSFFNRPGCGLFGCGVSLQFQQYDENKKQDDGKRKEAINHSGI